MFWRTCYCPKHQVFWVWRKYTVTKERVALILVLIARGAVRSIFKKEQGLCIIEHGINSLQIITTKDRKKIRRKKIHVCGLASYTHRVRVPRTRALLLAEG